MPAVFWELLIYPELDLRIYMAQVCFSTWSRKNDSKVGIVL